ncbi:MAG: pyridine nucleotide-disulfide oxidoreductase, partial [Methylocaldum sp.]|nr:pyridine nucleotide-disulfide oxidoreductase [Methylocaldum sp.]
MTDHSVRSDTGLSAASVLTLGISGFNYADLYEPERLKDLSDVFDATVRNHDPALFAEFERYRACQGEGMPPEKISDVLVKMAPYVGTFVARLFGVSSERDTQIQAIRDEFDSIFLYRNEIVGKVAGLFKNQALESWNIAGIQADFESLLRIAEPVLIESDREKAVAVLGARLHRWHQDASVSGREIAELRRTLATDPDTEARFAGLLGKSDEDLVKALLDLIQRWTYAVTQIPELKARVQGWASFKFPAKTDFNHLVHHETRSADGYSVWAAPEEHHRRREGFGLTDPRFPERRVLYEVDHCIYCHDRDTDSCSKGMRNKKDGTYKTNPLGVTITGCPLEEKISEMHVVKRQGDNIGALALITIDNPLCPGTGHRICNDCMKGCIYQKTEPVNIPQIETNVLTDVLFMPWGFEIYSLLTRWNPLNVKRPYALPYNGKNVLVAGMGPAGYTLAHYLTNEGFGVVGIDGLKIEPLPKDIVGD